MEISHNDALKLQTSFDKGDNIVLRIKTDYGQLTSTVEVDLWYTSSLDLGLTLSDELSALSYSFDTDHDAIALFTPRIATFSCEDCPKDFIQTNCVSNGLYCAFTPKFFDQYNLVELSGREILV